MLRTVRPSPHSPHRRIPVEENDGFKGLAYVFALYRNRPREHRYWSVVENCRVHGGRVVQRQVLYPSGINDSQRAAWHRATGCWRGRTGSRQVAGRVGIRPEARASG